MGSFIVAEHNSQGRLILAVCDSDIHGKRFDDGKAVLDLASKYFSGEKKDADAVEKLMLRAYAIHAVGKKSVAVAVKIGLAGKGGAKSVSGVPHVQVLMVN